MKKTLFMVVALSAIRLASFAQSVVNPIVHYPENTNTTITKIETNAQFTIVSFENVAATDNSWAEVNKEIFIQTDQGNEHYNFVKAENITIAPTRTTIAKAGEKLSFKVYFKKVPAATKSIDVVERAGINGDGYSFFNFYGVSLTESLPEGTKVKVTNVVLLPPPPVNPDNTGANQMQNAMNAMVPMYSSMAKSMLDANISYYKQPGKIAELAKLNRDYFKALVKEGFSYQEAITLMTSSSLFLRPSSISGQ